MYGRSENGTIKIHRKLPSKFKGITGNYAGHFDLQNNSVIEAEGFFPIDETEISRPKIYRRGNLVFNQDQKKYEYSQEEIYPGISLEQAKEKRIEELNSITYKLLSKTDWYYLRETRTAKLEAEGKRTKKTTPSEILDYDNSIFTQNETIEAEILALGTVAEVLEYEIKFIEQI